MRVPNFNDIDPKITWEKPRAESDNIKSGHQILKSIANNPKVLIPIGCAVAIITAFSMVNNIMQRRTNSLQAAHEEFSLISNRISSLIATNQRIEQKLETMVDFMARSLRPYVFGKELQTLIPSDIQFTSYSVSDQSINIEATSSSQQSIDEFIVFVSEHPLIARDSTRINSIKSSSTQASSGEFNTIQPRQIYNVSISATYQRLSIKEQEQLLEKNASYGMLQKLKQISPN